MNDQWRLVGKIKEAHGLKGDIYVLIFSGDSSWLKTLKEFAIAPTEKDSKKTFEIEKAKVFKNGFILKPKGINDRNESEKLKGQMFFVPSDLLKSKEGERIFLAEILNFEVYNFDQLIGPIVGFSSNGPQDLLVIKFQDHEVEIPFVEAFIRDLDFDSKKLLMELPEGLLELDSE
jgi:16S rRNA processing protein RimM